MHFRQFFLLKKYPVWSPLSIAPNRFTKIAAGMNPCQIALFANHIVLYNNALYKIHLYFLILLFSNINGTKGGDIFHNDLT
jgi:hypothetical protein